MQNKSGFQLKKSPVEGITLLQDFFHSLIGKALSDFLTETISGIPKGEDRPDF